MLHAAAVCQNLLLAHSDKLVPLFSSSASLLEAQDGSQVVIAVGLDFCIQTCKHLCNLVTVLLYTKKLENSSNRIYAI